MFFFELQVSSFYTSDLAGERQSCQESGGNCAYGSFLANHVEEHVVPT